MTGAFRFGFDNYLQLSIPFYCDEYSRRIINAAVPETKGTSRRRRGPRLAASEPPLDQRNSSSLDPQRATAAFPSLTSYAAARALAAINDARLALQKAA